MIFSRFPAPPRKCPRRLPEVLQEAQSIGKRPERIDWFTESRQKMPDNETPMSEFQISAEPCAETAATPPISICVLTYGNYADLAKRCLESIRRNCDRSFYRLIVGANAPGRATQKYLGELLAAGKIDRLIISPANINKCPMMRRMFALVDTEFIWWFDDDSYITAPDALKRWLRIAQSSLPATVQWGHQFFHGHERDFSYGADVVGFVRNAPWYRSQPPPSWEQGGKGEFNFEGRCMGDGRWFFVTGGCWMVRNNAIKALDWPDPRLIKRNDDVFLFEAIRQQGWQSQDIGPLGVVINTGPRRGDGEDAKTMAAQILFCKFSEHLN